MPADDGADRRRGRARALSACGRSRRDNPARMEPLRLITPRRSTSRRFHTPPDTWSRERIVQAFRDWAEETGSPPLSHEWCPSAARSAGLMGRAPCKWEREHPRWPGNTTVYRFFDSWSDAREAAGLPPGLRMPRGPLAERVEAAQRMRASGHSVRSIADHLELSLTTVYGYLKSHPCRECGGPVVRSAELCHRCSTRRGNPRRWSDDEVLDAIREWTRLEGRPPTQIDWRPRRHGGSERWQREFPRWPPAGVAQFMFGGWGPMLEAAGETPNHPSWEPAEILDALRRYAQEFGRAPSKTDLERPPGGYPSARTVRRHFGSFTAGRRKAGLTSFAPRVRRPYWTRERIAEAMAAFHDRHGRFPTSVEWARAGSAHPGAATVFARFESWESAKDAAGAFAGERRR